MTDDKQMCNGEKRTNTRSNLTNESANAYHENHHTPTILYVSTFSQSCCNFSHYNIFKLKRNHTVSTGNDYLEGVLLYLYTLQIQLILSVLKCRSN